MKLMSKTELTDKDEPDLMQLICIIKKEQSRTILAEVMCMDNMIPIMVCNCEMCNKIKENYEVK